MALRGEVRMSGETLWLWEAVKLTRLSHPPEPDDVYTYQCTVASLDRQRLQFEVKHRYGDGAGVLAAKLLQRAGAAIGGPS